MHQGDRHRRGQDCAALAWQNPYCERLVGSIRRECLDHVLVLNEQHLRRVLRSYVAYYHDARTQRSLDNDRPVPRAVEPPEMGDVIAFPQVGGRTIDTVGDLVRETDGFSPPTGLGGGEPKSAGTAGGPRSAVAF